MEDRGSIRGGGGREGERVGRSASGGLGWGVGVGGEWDIDLTDNEV